MNKLADLKTYMTKHSISHVVVESSVGVRFDDVTDGDVEGIATKLSELVSKRDFDESWFADLARSHGFSEEMIAIAASVEASPAVLSMFDPLSI
jgi:hypothetical protein